MNKNRINYEKMYKIMSEDEEFKKFPIKNFYFFPVRCESCGKILSYCEDVVFYWYVFKEVPLSCVLNKLGITKICCRTKIITNQSEISFKLNFETWNQDSHLKYNFYNFLYDLNKHIEFKEKKVNKICKAR